MMVATQYSRDLSCLVLAVCFGPCDGSGQVSIGPSGRGSMLDFLRILLLPSTCLAICPKGRRGMIDVRLFANLTAGTDHDRTEFQVIARPGLTVRGVAEQEEIRLADIQMILVNGKRASTDTPLADGDRLGLFPAVGGG
jgi:molybdopterin converting factor small subunit